MDLYRPHNLFAMQQATARLLPPPVTIEDVKKEAAKRGWTVTDSSYEGRPAIKIDTPLGFFITWVVESPWTDQSPAIEFMYDACFKWQVDHGIYGHA